MNVKTLYSKSKGFEQMAAIGYYKTGLIHNMWMRPMLLPLVLSDYFVSVRRRVPTKRAFLPIWLTGTVRPSRFCSSCGSVK